MKGVFVSTSMCPLSKVPDLLLQSWQDLCHPAGPSGISLDPRMPHELQQAVLALANGRGIECHSIVHPIAVNGNQRPPSPVSQDAAERMAAVNDLVRTAQLACDGEVRTVLCVPWALDLQPSAAAAAELRQLGAPNPLPELLQRRAGLARSAFDALCSALDAVMAIFEQLRVQLVLHGPTAWPHQFPAVAELDGIMEIFNGAPLGRCFAADWWHVGNAILATANEPRSDASTEMVRVADACGLWDKLPLGTGEMHWSRVVPIISGAEAAVLTYSPSLAVTSAEVTKGVEMVRAAQAAR